MTMPPPPPGATPSGQPPMQPPSMPPMPSMQPPMPSMPGMTADAQPGYAQTPYGQGGYGQPQMSASVPFASWGQRVVAAILDSVFAFLLFIPVLILSAVAGAISEALGVLIGLLGYLALIGLSFYFQYLTGKRGQSPGKQVVGIQVVHANTGQFIGGGMGIVRNFAHVIDAIPCYAGFFFPLFDSKKQTLADKVMTTVVVAGPKSDFGTALKSLIPGK
jgi:uncharacterized RDD family membrane protein YckC